MQVYEVTDSRGDVYRVWECGGDVVVAYSHGGSGDYLLGEVWMPPAIARQVAANMLALCDEMEAKGGPEA